MHLCPFCCFESKCETILNNHMNIHGGNLFLLDELEENLPPANCSCDSCRSEQFQLDEFPDLPNSIRVESEEELLLLPDEINENTILVDPVRFEPNFQKRWFKCDQCKYKSRHGDNLRRHLIIKHGDGTVIPWYYCDYCPHKCKQKSAMTVHIKHRHLADDEIDWFYCDVCSYRSKTKSSMGNHKTGHVRPEHVKWHQCSHCEYKARNRSRLNKHKSELHSKPGEINWLKCQYCLMYVTRRNSSLKLHIRRKHSAFLK